MKDFNVPIQSLIDHIKTATDVDPWAKEMAEDLLKEQEAMSWINVKDGLPNENGSYLVVYKAFQYAFVDVKRFAKDLYSVDEYDFPNEHRPGWYEYDDEYGYIERNDITHWMPLPNLPEKGR